MSVKLSTSKAKKCLTCADTLNRDQWSALRKNVG